MASARNGRRQQEQRTSDDERDPKVRPATAVWRPLVMANRFYVEVAIGAPVAVFVADH